MIVPTPEGSEMGRIDQNQTNVLGYLAELGPDGVECGPFIGRSALGGWPIHLPESSLENNVLVLGCSDYDRITVMKRILVHRLSQKAREQCPGAIVVIDSCGDLVKDILRLVPPSISSKVRLLDFGRMDRVPGINLLDPVLFPDPNHLVNAIVEDFRSVRKTSDEIAEEILRNSVLMAYSFNAHADTKPPDTLTILDIPIFLHSEESHNHAHNSHGDVTYFQQRALSKVYQLFPQQWFARYLDTAREVHPDSARLVIDYINSFHQDRRLSVIFGQRRTTRALSELSSDGLVLLVSMPQAILGAACAALIGSAIISLVQSLSQRQDSSASVAANDFLLACDQFADFMATDWEGLLGHEGSSRGCSIVLGTSSLVRNDTKGRRLQRALLSSVGTYFCYRVVEEDAMILGPELWDPVEQKGFLAGLDPHLCYARITSDSRTFQPLPVIVSPDLKEVDYASAAVVLQASEDYTVPLTDSGRAK